MCEVENCSECRTDFNACTNVFHNEVHCWLADIHYASWCSACVRQYAIEISKVLEA